jgi:hypothetical protein
MLDGYWLEWPWPTFVTLVAIFVKNLLTKITHVVLHLGSPNSQGFCITVRSWMCSDLSDLDRLLWSWGAYLWKLCDKDNSCCITLTITKLTGIVHHSKIWTSSDLIYLDLLLRPLWPYLWNPCAQVRHFYKVHMQGVIMQLYCCTRDLLRHSVITPRPRVA